MTAHTFFLLLAVNALEPADQLRLVGCSAAFETQFHAEWAVERPDPGTKDELQVTCLADGKVMLEAPAVNIRKTLDLVDVGDDVSHERVVAVIAAELLAEGKSRRPRVLEERKPSAIVQAKSEGAALPQLLKPSPKSVLFSVQAGGSSALGAGLQGGLQGAFVGVNRGTSWASGQRRTVATIEGAYEATEVARSLGIVRASVLSVAALLGVQSLGSDLQVSLSGGIKAGSASMQGLPTLGTNHGDNFSAGLVSPVLRLTLSIPWRRLSMFARVDGGYSLRKVRAQVVDEPDAALAGQWCNVGLGFLLSLN